MAVPCALSSLIIAEQAPRLFRGERCGRFVEDEKLLLLVEHFENLEDLAISDLEPLRRDIGIEPNVETLRPSGSSSRTERRRMKPKALVGSCPRAKFWATVSPGSIEEVLMDNMKSKRTQQRGRWRVDLSSLKQHLAAGLTMDASKDLDEGRFACAVFTEQRVESPRLQLKVDLAKREGWAKSLGDAAQLQKRNTARSDIGLMRRRRVPLEAVGVAASPTWRVPSRSRADCSARPAPRLSLSVNLLDVQFSSDVGDRASGSPVS